MIDLKSAKEAILNGDAIRSSDASASAQAWLRREAAGGRIAKLTNLVGWCPAHTRWIFYVGANRAPEFVAKCRRDYAKLIDAAAMDEMVRGRVENACRLHAMASQWRQAA